MKNSTLFIIIAAFLIITGDYQTFATESKSSVVEVANLEELRKQNADNSTVYRVTGEVIMTHKHPSRNQKYFQDQHGAIVVDDSGKLITTNYDLYDGVKGLTGKLNKYAELLQFIPTEDPGQANSVGNTITPLLLTLNEIKPEHQARLIRVNDVEFTGTATKFEPSKDYPISDGSTTAVIFRTPTATTLLDYFNTSIPTEKRNIILLVGQFNATMQVFARSLSDFYADGIPAYDISFEVVDENNDPITDAVLTFNNQALAAGTYTITGIEAGSYSYSIEKAGFYIKSGQLGVTDDVTKKIVLVAISANAINTFPWTEGFENAFPPAHWTHKALGSGGWFSSSTAQTGAKAAGHNPATAGEANSWLISPQINIGADDVLLLKFFHRNSFIADYKYAAVKISTGSMNPLHDEYVVLFEAKDGLSSYTEKVINLKDYAGKTVYIAFVYKGQNGHQWLVDNVRLEQAPASIQVNNIAQLRQQTIGDQIYHITGEVVITHQQLGYRGQIFIQDDSGAIMIDDAAKIIQTVYDNYDGIINLKGKIADFQNMLQLVPTEDPGVAKSKNNAVTPVVVTLENFDKSLESKLIVIKNATFKTPGGNFAHNASYEFNTDNTTITGILRTPNSVNLLNYFGTPIPSAKKDLVGVVTQRYEETRILPRSLSDFQDSSTSVFEAETASFRLYPNPARNHFIIQGEEQIANIRLYSLSGQLILQKAVEDVSVRVECNDIPAGLYIMQVMYDNKIVNKKLQIQR
jgi:hypothetical protein